MLGEDLLVAALCLLVLAGAVVVGWGLGWGHCWGLGRGRGRCWPAVLVIHCSGYGCDSGVVTGVVTGVATSAAGCDAQLGQALLHLFARLFSDVRLAL